MVSVTCDGMPGVYTRCVCNVSLLMIEACYTSVVNTVAVFLAFIFCMIYIILFIFLQTAGMTGSISGLAMTTGTTVENLTSLQIRSKARQFC